MIDSTFIWEQNVAIEIDKATWDAWSSSFVEVIIAREYLFVTPQGGYRLVSSSMPSSSKMFWWEAERTILECTGGKDAFLAYMTPKMSYCDGPPSDDQVLRLIQRVYQQLISDRTVMARFKAHAAQAKANKIAELERVRDQVKQSIRVECDEKCGLEVQFLVPTANPEHLYYTIGSELWLIKDLYKFMAHGASISIGNFEPIVDFSPPEADPYLNYDQQG